MTPVRRTIMFHVRMTDDERRMLEAVAEKKGLSASDWIRQRVRDAYRREFGSRELSEKDQR